MTTGPTTVANPAEESENGHGVIVVLTPSTLQGADTMANPTMDILDIVRKRVGDDSTGFLREALSTLRHGPMDAEVNFQAAASCRERRG